MFILFLKKYDYDQNQDNGRWVQLMQTRKVKY